MKKAIMFIALVATSMVGANAQKFQGGEKNLEVEFNPLSDKPIGMPNGFRFRMFNSESSAIRVGFNVGGGKNTEVYQQQYVEVSDGKDVTIPELYQTNKSFNFTIRPGYEKHFAGTDRLSPYVGAELMYKMERSTLSREFHSANTATDFTEENFANYQVWEASVKTGANTIGLNALAGVDFYFADNFYLGVEINLGFHNTKYKDRETTIGNENAYKFSAEAQGDLDFYQAGMNDLGTAVEYSTIIGTGNPPTLALDEETGDIIGVIESTSPTKTTGWGPNFQSTLRLGWLF